MGAYTGCFLFLFVGLVLIMLLLEARRSGPAETITRRRLDRWE